MKILDIGCGENKTPGSIGLDMYHLNGVDVIWDLEKTPLPFKDKCFDIIVANHVLEHIENFIALMEDIHRILKTNGLLKIRVPFFTSAYAFTNPTHKRFFTYTSFEYFEKGYPEGQYTKYKYKIVKRSLNLSFNPKFRSFSKIINPLINKFPIIYQQLFSHILPCEELIVELKPI